MRIKCLGFCLLSVNYPFCINTDRLVTSGGRKKEEDPWKLFFCLVLFSDLGGKFCGDNQIKIEGGD